MLKTFGLLAAAFACQAQLASAADVAAGKAATQAKCVQCHQATDWEGEDAAALQSLIADIVAGKIKHKQKIELSAAEIENIAAYWGSAGKATKQK